MVCDSSSALPAQESIPQKDSLVHPIISIQPVVENSVKTTNGIEPSKEPAPKTTTYPTEPMAILQDPTSPMVSNFVSPESRSLLASLSSKSLDMSADE